jgi:ceramide glucosyltransferase
MSPHIFRLVAALAGLGALGSVGYYALCLWSASRFLREADLAGEGGRATEDLPPVSILKPLKGTDREMYESLRSHCLQDYPEYEIIFGVSEENDPALKFVERLKREFPQLAIREVFCAQKLGANTKISNLAQMLPEARYKRVIVNDSDIRVEGDYLRRVMRPFSDPACGMVTCLYRGIAGASLGSRLEALGISTDFAAGVLAARQLENGMRFGLGSTLACRRQDLQAIGGFEGLADYLGDDYEIGRRIAKLGLKVELSQVVVETFLPQYRLGEFFEHQLRWSRNIRDSRRAGYAGLGLTFGIPWALLALVFAGYASWAWGLLAVVIAMRAAVAWTVGWKVLRDRQVFRLLWLLPVRDVVAMGIWIAGFAGNKIMWRGEAFELRNGKLGRL